ncbi:MAG: molybdopterin-guanine dinucleotide biosynthesis protein B [Deltaproteobacteria bacterium]|nr:molybdopterin-guanine dinucleotide biosynthesis protein B [Deltaproteobacteria bacterium]
MNKMNQPPIVSVVGYSGAGKTTLMEKLIGELTRRGYRVGSIKHDVHGFEMDKPGKDSWRHKQAGASTTLISSPHQIGMVMDVDHDHSPDELKKFFNNVNIILTEGYKKQDRPKVEIFRSQIHHEPLCRNDDNIVAIMSDIPVDLKTRRFTLEDVGGLVDFLVERFNLTHNS